MIATSPSRLRSSKRDLWDLEKAMEAKIKDNGGGCIRSLKE